MRKCSLTAALRLNLGAAYEFGEPGAILGTIAFLRAMLSGRYDEHALLSHAISASAMRRRRTSSGTDGELRTSNRDLPLFNWTMPKDRCVTIMPGRPVR